MQGNEKEEQMEDLEVKIILTSKLQMIIVEAINLCFIMKWTMKYIMKNL